MRALSFCPTCGNKYAIERTTSHFSYTFLRNAFRTALLDEMESRIGSSFKKVKSRCYREHKDGFYVYAKPNKCEPKTAIKYIGRYLGRPVIATSRIDKYDGDFVTFHYNRHKDDTYVKETLSVMEFIERLIRHIPFPWKKVICMTSPSSIPVLYYFQMRTQL